MVFSNFLNFFAVFLEFSIMGRVGPHRNIFFFLSFVGFPNLFWLVKKLRWCFLIFGIFLLFFEFSITGRVGTHRNSFLLIFSLSQPFPTNFGLKRSDHGIFKFFEFFTYFVLILYYRSCRNTAERFFLFSLFLSLSLPILA